MTVYTSETLPNYWIVGPDSLTPVPMVSVLLVPAALAGKARTAAVPAASLAKPHGLSSRFQAGIIQTALRP